MRYRPFTRLTIRIVVFVGELLVQFSSTTSAGETLGMIMLAHGRGHHFICYISASGTVLSWKTVSMVILPVFTHEILSSNGLRTLGTSVGIFHTAFASSTTIIFIKICCFDGSITFHATEMVSVPVLVQGSDMFAID